MIKLGSFGGSFIPRTSDEETAYVLRVCHDLQIRVHVRGDDSRPVIEYTDKITGRVVGGIELKRRIKSYGVSL